MKGPCLCGDTECPGCGPAQGYLPHTLEDILLEAVQVLRDMVYEIDGVFYAGLIGDSEIESMSEELKTYLRKMHSYS